MSEFKYISNVTDEEFKAALGELEIAIAKKDTPEEWAKFTGNVLLFVGKMGISHIGLGPVIKLVDDIFGDDAKLITKLLKKIGEENETD